MDIQRLQEILDGFYRARILVVGDFFLDKYLILDAELTEESLETGLPAYQVVEKRLSPGAAGTVVGNLRALEAGAVQVLGMIGQDGEGEELKAGLAALGVNPDGLIRRADRFTPTYTKPMLRESGSEREMSRLDIKNRQPCPADVETEVIARLRELVPQVDGVIVADQVQERNCGVITDAVRAELANLSARYPQTMIIADSRVRISEFYNVWIKPNRSEAAHILQREAIGLTLEDVAELGRSLQARNNRPLFITLAEDGLLAVHDDVRHVPTLRQTGAIDVCGAGDSTVAAMTLALCSGATPEEAAIIGNLVASITVQQIGTTGTATRAQVLARFTEFGEQFTPRIIA